jgi:hypothetical protein
MKRTLLTLGLVAPVVWLLTWLLVATSPYGVSSGGLTLLLIFGTLAAACIVGASVRSPFGDSELATAHPLAPVRFGHLVVVLLWATLVLSAALLSFDLGGARPEQPLLVLFRNLAGFSGLALVSAWISGARFSWIPPFVAAIAYLTLMGTGGDPLSRWAMRSYDGTHGSSWVVSLTLLTAGLVVVSLLGTREAVDDAG